MREIKIAVGISAISGSSIATVSWGALLGIPTHAMTSPGLLVPCLSWGSSAIPITVTPIPVAVVGTLSSVLPVTTFSPIRPARLASNLTPSMICLPVGSISTLKVSTSTKGRAPEATISMSGTRAANRPSSSGGAVTVSLGFGPIPPSESHAITR